LGVFRGYPRNKWIGLAYLVDLHKEDFNARIFKVLLVAAKDVIVLYLYVS